MKANEFINQSLDENLHKWFREKWVRFGPDGKIRGDCARGSDSEGKPKCLPQSKAHALGKKGRATAASRKRRKDPNPERTGKAINVKTEDIVNETPHACPECGGPAFGDLVLAEKKDACYSKVRSRYKVWPSAYASGALVQCRKKGAANWGNKSKKESAGQLDERCWDGYEQQGMKKKGDHMVPNCVATEDVAEAANPAQQAAIAIAMKKAHKKPQVTEFAPPGDGDDNGPDEEEILFRLAKQWWNGSEPEMIRAQRTLASMGWEIGEDEGYDEGGVFVVRAGDVNGNSYMSWSHNDLDEVNEGVAEGSDPWGPQGRFVGDTGPAQISATMPDAKLKVGDRVLYRPTEQPATIEALSRDHTQARIHIVSPMGGRTLNCRTSDLKSIGHGLAEGTESVNEEKQMTQEPNELARILQLGGVPQLDESLVQEFDLIESIIEDLADRNGVDSELIWEDLESLSDDELYVFAVTTEPVMEDWQKANKRDRTDGMSQKAVNAYRREHPGSKLKTAVTTKPSKLKKGSKASKRRKSYCSRSRGQMKMHNISCAKTPDKAICKARRRWNC